jgi:hypothetical protein
MARVTINIDPVELRLVRERAEETGSSLSAYVAEAARRRALTEYFAEAAAAEAEHPPTDEEMRRDGARIAAKAAAPEGISGAA